MKKLTEKKRKIYWRITVAVAVVLIIITFTPLVLTGKIQPKLFSMPFTLWVSMLITIVLVALTYIGGRIHLKDKE